MPKYHVHVYLIVRETVCDIEAASQLEACHEAERIINLAPPPNYADDIDGFLVDEDGDTEHRRSASYDANYVRREFKADG
jgi:hypothetical protein